MDRGGAARSGNGSGRAPAKSVTCPISQGEPYYLGAAYKDHPAFGALKTGGRILSPVIDLSKGCEAAEGVFLEMARTLGRTVREGRRAYAAAVQTQKAVETAMREAGRRALEELQADPAALAVVVFGRSYNAFVSEAHMGIPRKFATRGVRVIPIDMLPTDDEPVHGQMYWSAGQAVLKAASYVERHSAALRLLHHEFLLRARLVFDRVLLVRRASPPPNHASRLRRPPH